MTPKSLALGMSTRHLTGSSKLINLLNGLGHCSSRDTLQRLETSLAFMHANDALGVPNGAVSHQFTILVWDNIDFSEETMSGHGTTHHTNGIRIQQVTSGLEVHRSGKTALSKKKKKNI